MPVATRRRSALAAAGLAATLFASTALAATEESSTELFLRQEGCGATAGPGLLSTTSGADTADGCGTIGGIPLNEAFHQLEGSATADDFSTTAEDGVPLVLDAARDLQGVVSAQSWVGVVGGVGEVVMEVTVTGRTIGDNGRPVSKVLGSGTFSAAASPVSERVAVPFTLDLPAELQGMTFTGLSLSLVTRGANVNANAQSLNGSSKFTVPTLVETAE